MHTIRYCIATEFETYFLYKDFLLEKRAKAFFNECVRLKLNPKIYKIKHTEISIKDL